MPDGRSLWIRFIGVVEILLSLPLLALGVLVLGGIPVNGLIILGNAGASYLLGRYTYRTTTTVGRALLNLCNLVLLMLLSFVLCRVITDVVSY